MDLPEALPENVYDTFSGILCRLSPENLSNDGELTWQEVESRVTELRGMWIGLEAAVGGEVSEDEVYHYENCGRVN